MSENRKNNKSSHTHKNNNYYNRSKKRGKSHTKAAGIILIIAAAAVTVLLISAINTGRIFSSSDENGTAVISTSVLEAQARQRAAEEAARKAAEEKEKAEKEAAEKERLRQEEEAKKKAAEEKLLAEHPEMGAKITLQMPYGDEVIDRKVVQSWETDNGDGTWTKDEDKWNQSISDFVARLADKTDTIGKPHTFNATGIGQIEVDGNQYYGWQIDQTSEISQLTDELNSGKTVTREPNYFSRESAKSDDNGGIGQTYCEIDASRQHLWIYQNGQLQFETDVVTGLMDKAHYTPEGVYLLLGKEQNATLKGEQLPNGKRTYETPVKYWMPITDTGIGLHDASWKYVFGRGQNEWNGSHGCINLPADVAGTVYDLLNMDTPIVIYYSEPYELREAPPSAVDQYLAAQQQAAAAAQQAAAQQTQQAEEQNAQQSGEEASQQTPPEAAAGQDTQNNQESAAQDNQNANTDTAAPADS